MLAQKGRAQKGPAQSAPAGELAGIQMLRALAALAVVALHALAFSRAASVIAPDWAMNLGAAGVDVFFVISGFIMLHTSFRPGRPSMPAGRFLLRRFIRIYPLYWLCTAAMLAVMAAGFMRHNLCTAQEIALSLALLPSPHLVLPVAWTLVLEIYFYLVFAATLPLASRTATLILTSVAIVGLQGAGTLLPAGALRTFLTVPMACEFLLGLWLAWAFSRMGIGVTRLRRQALCLAVLGLVLLAAAAGQLRHPDSVPGVAIPSGALGVNGWWRVLSWGVPSALITAAFLAVPTPRGRLGRGLVVLGDASYAIYLVHLFVVDAYSVARLVERPLLRVLQGWSERLSTPQATDHAAAGPTSCAPLATTGKTL